MSSPAPVAAARPQLPRIVPVLGAAGLAIAMNQYVPGVLERVLLLVILYVALTNVPKVLDLINTAPAGLARAYSPAGKPPAAI